jgi:hypothetical protein
MSWGWTYVGIWLGVKAWREGFVFLSGVRGTTITTTTTSDSFSIRSARSALAL